MTKESLRGIDKRLIFREGFVSEQATRDNGSIDITGVTYNNGVATFDGVDGTDDGISATPVAGTANIIIGNNSSNNTTFDGNIPITKVVSGIATIKQIENYYNATKRYFGK